MSVESSLLNWNPWFVEKRVSDALCGITREKLEHILKLLETPLIKDIVGVRRCGKTTLLYQIIDYIIRNLAKPEDVFLINFEDPIIYNTSFDDILSSIRRMNPEAKYLFLDEVQEKEGWERWVRSLFDLRVFKQIFITGSSSSLLKTEFSKLLTGRHITVTLFPFSFKEYLIFHKWPSFEPRYLSLHKDELLFFLRNYLKYGGFPEVQSVDDVLKVKILNDLFDDIVARDISARYRADYYISKRIAYYIISNIAKPLSLRSIANATHTSVDTVSKYINYLIDSFLILPLRKFSFKLKEQMREINKYYCIDLGLANVIGFHFSINIGRIMENLVYIELIKRFSEDKSIEIYYYKANNNEVDFIIKRGLSVIKLIQVCYSFTSERTKKREVSALLKAMNKFNISEGYVITWDYEKIENYNNKRVIFRPLWKFLLLDVGVSKQ
ncbi:MAG: ATP-binding protein [Candidatus Odinarchaeota archaeon]|nr:ATP-binding protein [Candidatus Odinarchaeota archaeon]